MSEGEGNSKEKRFRRFHERVSEASGCTEKQRLPFAPDFFDSLARVMAIPGDLDERTLAWSKYFAWGNYNEFAIRIEGDGKELRLTQTDCARDLAWLEAGIRIEWLDAPSHIRDAELSRLGIKPIDKSLVSKAFTSNENRGTIVPSPPTDRRYSTARTIEPAVSPAGPRPVNVDDSQEFHEFQAWFKVEHSQEFHEREVARSIIKHVNRVELSLYKEWRAAKRTRPPSYKPPETEKSREEIRGLSSSSLVKEEEPVESQKSTTTTEPRPLAPLLAETLPPVPVPPRSSMSDPKSHRPASEAEKRYASDRDELVALLHEMTGRMPDQRLMRDIPEAVELRGWTLREYLDDIRPRIPRLDPKRGRPTEGFFLKHAQKLGGMSTTAAPEPETLEQKAERTGPCGKCHGIGKVDSAYCTCRMGKDLERVEKRAIGKGSVAQAGGGSEAE